MPFFLKKKKVRVNKSIFGLTTHHKAETIHTDTGIMLQYFINLYIRIQ